jgi:hypothetical protein
MSAWVKCTRPDGQTLLVNLDRAVSLAREGAAPPTKIRFDGGQETLVKETPERLLDDDFEDATGDDD